MDITCPTCRHLNRFEQPYPYHAGHSDQGFLYNDAGNLILVWSSYDPDWERLAGRVHPWTVDAAAWSRIENAIRPAADGSRWRAANPPRCLACREPIGRSILDGEISYLVYPGSSVLDNGPKSRRLAEALGVDSQAT